MNKQGHVKQDSNNPKMELNLAQNQPQEAKWIELGRNIGGEEACKEKKLG